MTLKKDLVYEALLTPNNRANSCRLYCKIIDGMNIDLATILNKYKDQKPKKNSGDIIWERSYPVSAVISIVDEYAEQFKPKWIPVTERLPDKNIKVLVVGEQMGMNPQMGGAYTCISERIDVPKILSRESNSYVCENGFKRMQYVTHWMPLPDAP